jgi:hypothetical protein
MRIAKMVLLGLVCTLSIPLMAQPPVPVAGGATPKAVGADTSKKPSASKSNVKSFKDFNTPGTQSDAGLFTIYKQEDKYFAEIPSKLFNRDILVVSRVSKSSAAVTKGFYGYNGDEIGSRVIRFERGPKDKIFIRTIFYNDVSRDSTREMYRAVQNSNVQPISAAFDIKFNGKDSTGFIIDITDYANGDNDIMFFEGFMKSAFGIASQQTDKSYIVSVNSYPINVEVKTVKTYSKAPNLAGGAGLALGLGGSLGTVTMELNTSFIVLPEKPMRPRIYDDRVGYFTTGFSDFDADPQSVKTTRMAIRWRLEPKPEDVEKYMRGELVEPKNPIVYYIDPATPEKWIPFLIQGVNDWSSAFEKAGFKNAVIGKRAPTKAEDSTWTLEDARNSAIVYKASAIENAYGPTVTDPRSGEIIESHIGWFHNVMALLRDWYFIQASPSDLTARKPQFSDELMGQLIRFVSSHEVGHTLGLRHNFGSSSTVPTEKLRDKAWVEANGHTPSIMDYARFNYVAQPEDNISQAGLFPRIGDYDNWAIEWGYKYFADAKDEYEEKKRLSKLTTQRLANKRLWFGQESNRDDSRSQSEDVGDNSMKSSEYGIKNLQYILKNIQSWIKEDAGDYDDLRTLYNNIVFQYARYVGHVTKHVGSIWETPKTQDQAGVIYQMEPKAMQKEAMAFLTKQVFTTPKWLVPTDILNKLGQNATTVVLDRQEGALGRLLSTYTLGKMVGDPDQAGGAATMYTAAELLDDLRKAVFTELGTGKPIDLYRRNLQKAYVERLVAIINPPAPSGFNIFLGGPAAPSPSADSKKSDVMSLIKAHAKSLRASMLGGNADRTTAAHLSDMADRIQMALEKK